MKSLRVLFLQMIIYGFITNLSIGQSTLTVVNGGKMQITTGTSVQSQNLDIGNSSRLDLQGDLTVSGVLANDAGTPGFILRADASGQGSLMNNSTGVMATTEQFLESDRWHLISSPVVWASVTAYWDIYLKDWTEQNSTWYYIENPDLWPYLYPTEGYAVWADDALTGTTTVSLEGELITGDAAYNYLSYTPGASQDGWNLVGNPYPSALEWNTDWFVHNISGWAVFYEDGVYTGWNPWMPVGQESWNGRTSGWMAANQGFWIRAVDAGPYMTSPQSARAHSATPFYKEEQLSDIAGLHLIANANEFSDEAVILFMEEGTAGFDGLYDLSKMFNVDEAPNIYSIPDFGENLSVNVLPENWIQESNTPVIPIGFKITPNTSCLLRIEGIETIDVEVPIFLEDLKENEMTDLRMVQEYSFSSLSSDDPNRFLIHFGNPDSMKDNLSADIGIYSYKGSVYIQTPFGYRGHANVYDISGRRITELQLNGGLSAHLLPGTGYYMVQIKGDMPTVRKVFIKN